MANPPGSIVRQSSLDFEKKTLDIVLSIPFILYPENGDTMTNAELRAHILTIIPTWTTQLTTGLHHEPMRKEAIRAIFTLTMQRTLQLAWEAEARHDWKQSKFYNIVAELILEARTHEVERHRALEEAHEEGVLELDEVGMKVLGVHAVAPVVRRLWREREGAPKGLEDIPEEGEG